MALVRRNGIIRIPGSLWIATYQALRPMMQDLQKAYADCTPASVPSSEADPLRRDTRRVRRARVTGIHTVYGRQISPFVLEVWVSREGYELVPPEGPAHGWFVPGGVGFDWSAGFRSDPTVAIAVSMEDIAGRWEAGLSPRIPDTLRHEMRHFIQGEIDNTKPVSDLFSLNAAGGGGPPLRVTNKKLDAKRRAPVRSGADVDDPDSAYRAYLNRDIEFQPHLATLIERLGEEHYITGTPVEELVKRAADSPLLRAYREYSPEKWRAAVGTIASTLEARKRRPALTPVQAHLQKRPVRKNGIIRLPDGLLEHTLWGLVESIKRLQRSYDVSYPESPPSSAADPHLKDMRRRQAVLIRGNYTVYGKAVPPLVLAAWLSAEGQEVAGPGLWRTGWFDRTYAGEGKYHPLIGVAVAFGHMRKPDSVLYDPKIRETVAHELRHLVQYMLDPDVVIDWSTTRGGPPRAATSKRISKRQGLPAQDSSAEPDEHAAYTRYVTSDIEFQPHLAALVERLCRKRDHTTTTASLMKEALASPSLEQWRQHAPEKWRAAVKTIAAALEDRPPLPSYAKSRVDRYLRKSPEGRELERKENQRRKAWLQPPR